MEDQISVIKEEISSHKKVRVAINGFGRIGRMIYRAAFHNPDIEIVAVNDLGPIDHARYFLQHDSSQGEFEKTISVQGDFLVCGDLKTKYLSERDPHNLPWKELHVDVVAECTGIFKTTEDAKVHITQGAKKVLISAPGKGECFYLVRGVNDHEYSGQTIVSNGSCTTNSMSAIVDRLHKKFGIVKGMFSTVHSVTGDQRILDANHSDVRRGRAGCFNIVPTTTGAAKAVIKLIPELDGKLHGIAYRVPTPTGSVTDLNLELNTKTTIEEINSFLKHICSTELHGIIQYSEEPLVSSDIVGNSHSGIIDAQSTTLVDGSLLKLVVWYDNEWGFSNRMVEVLSLMGNFK
jgi:glyceraldehyde 3-phosphate dehydrogenase